MKKIYFYRIISICIVLAAQTSAVADGVSDHLWLGITAAGGVQGVFTSDTNFGYLLNGRVSVEYQSDSWGALSIAGGAQKTWQTLDSSSGPLSTSINAFFAELSYLYPVIQADGGNRFWVGVLANAQIGPGALFDSSDLQSSQTFPEVGLHLRYDIDFTKIHFVIGTEVLYGLNTPSKTILTFPVYLGVMIPLNMIPKSDRKYERPPEREVNFDSPPVPQAAAPPAPQAALQAAVQQPPAPEPVVPQPVVPPPVAVAPVPHREPRLHHMDIPLEDRDLEFEFERAELKPKSREHLEHLARKLMEQRENWESMDIVSHAERGGNPKRSFPLAEERARKVRETLVRSGVPERRLSSRATPSSEFHRRMDLSIDGVREEERLRREVDSAFRH